MNQTTQLSHASVDFNEHGTPVAEQFDDVYFSNANGLAESRFVFIEGNSLHERWPNHARDTFTILETGFGTGLNMLACWQAFNHFRAENPDSRLKRLHFVSTEAFPIAPEDLKKALAQWPELSELAEQLVANYPLAIPGVHRLIIAENVTLDLWFGDINEMLPNMAGGEFGVFDACFLDGFAPSKNPQMWSDTLFSQLARLLRPGGTFATFTAAGLVKNGLDKAGLHWRKEHGFGQKRDMLVGYKSAQAEATANPNQQTPIAVIGGGIAACELMEALTRRGTPVEIFCSDTKPGLGASGNRQGALYPLLNQEHNELSQFYLHGFLHARRNYDRLAKYAPFPHQWCGVVHLNANEKLKKKHDSILAAQFPEQVIRGVPPEEASQLAGVKLDEDAVYYGAGGWVSPQKLCRALLERADQNGQEKGSHLAHHFSCRIVRLLHDDSGWTLTDSHQRKYGPFQKVIIATGYRATELLREAELPIHGVRGQLSYIAATDISSQLRAVLCHTGYVTPALGGEHSVGASFVRDGEEQGLTEDEHQENLRRLHAGTANAPFTDELTWEHDKGRVGIRARVRDHLPLVGKAPRAKLKEGEHPQRLIDWPVLPECYVLTALGARGLTSAPLSAELLASMIHHEPLPLPIPVVKAVLPARFAWRRWRKEQRGIAGNAGRQTDSDSTPPADDDGY